LGSAFSIVLDKKEMNSITGVVIQTAVKETEITDKELVRMIVGETMTATGHGSKIRLRSNYIRLYHGDMLVREMSQGAFGHLQRVVVYQTDNKHFNAPSPGGNNWGEVMLSGELLKRIEEALLEDGNFYPDD